MTTRNTCRATGSADLRTILDFGETPLADVLIEESELDQVEPKYPLHLVFCPDSSLVQITEDVPPDILYSSDYPYYTSVNPGLVEHFRKAAEGMLARKPLGSGSLVIEAASNDGYQLRVFRDRGIPVLGVDPASGPVAAANEAGLTSVCRFFDAELARELAAEGSHADLLTGNNVLNLVQDLDDFLEAVDLVLKPDGLLCLEVPYLVDTIDKTAFDNVFHQNVTYWTATSLDCVFRRQGLFLNDVEQIDTFGGSLRVFFERMERPSTAVTVLLGDEQRRGVDGFAFYEAFAGRVAEIKAELTLLIEGLRRDGKRVVAYGAAGGMATTLLAYLDLPEGTFDYAVDINPHKHGRFTAGSRLLIRPAETLIEDRPDVALLLAWNFADAILSSQKDYCAGGGRFIIPIPNPVLV